MKVQDLINTLMRLDPDIEVMLAKDAEGNAYRRLVEISLERVGDAPWDYDDDEDVRVVLWPL